MYEIETESVYDDFSKNKEMFDFSNYSVESKYDDDLNVKLTCLAFMREFIFLMMELMRKLIIIC